MAGHREKSRNGNAKAMPVEKPVPKKKKAVKKASKKKVASE